MGPKLLLFTTVGGPWGPELSALCQTGMFSVSKNFEKDKAEFVWNHSSDPERKW